MWPAGRYVRNAKPLVPWQGIRNNKFKKLIYEYKKIR